MLLRLMTALFVLTLPCSAYADYLILTTGQVLEGEIQQDDGEWVEIKTAQGVISVRREQIAKMGEGRPPKADTSVPRRRVRADRAPVREAASRRTAHDVRREVARRMAERQRARDEARKLIKALRDLEEDESGREAVEHQLVSLRPASADVLKPLLRDPDPAMRRVGVRALAGVINAADYAEDLAQTAVYDPEAELRALAAKLAGLRPVALPALVNAALNVKGLKGPVAVDRAVETLRNTGNPAVIPVVIGYARMEIRATWVRSAGSSTANISGISPEGQALNLPVELPTTSVTQVKTTVAVPILEVLGGLTGKQLGSVAGYTNWWKQHGANFAFDD